MKNLLALIALIMGICHPERTAAQSLDLGGSTTRAVVIGISDYREPLIPDLRFADRDAEAFATWLRSPAGGSLPDSNIVLLKNEKATNIQMIVSLDWLIEASQPGDHAFIYFSGHGDVERVTKFQRGFLLGHDSPPAVYGAGAFSLNYLQDILTTLAEHEVQVFLITDACRAGKLGGSSVGGSQVTAAQLSQQFANEIKILSCQPDELSLEGDQWGGGRGCFSYHLEDALYGFADQNADASVDLRELRRYLEDHVSAEAAPQSQTPIVSGPVQTAIAQVQEAALAAWKAGKGSQPVPFRDVENRGMEALLLAKADTSVQRLYKQFLAAIEAKRLMSPQKGQAPDSSANAYFNLLVNRPEAAALRGNMKRKFAAALIEEGQTVINKLLQTDPQMVDNIWFEIISYDHLPSYFHRACEILGEGHYAYKDLKSKEYYFQAKSIRADNYPDSTVQWRNNEKKRLLQTAIALDSTFAVAYQEISYAVPAEQKLEYLNKAVQLAPNWTLANFSLGFRLAYEGKYDKGISMLKRAIAIDSSFLSPYNWIAAAYWLRGGSPDSTYLWRKLYVDKYLLKFQADSISITAYECNDLGNAFWALREHDKAKKYLLMGEQKSKGMMNGLYCNLIVVYVDLLEFENAISAHAKLIKPWLYGWEDVPGSIYFNFLFDSDNAFKSWASTEDKAGIHQIEGYFSVENFEKSFRLAKRNVGTEPDYDWQMLHYVSESARQLGQADTACFYFRKITENAKVKFRPHSLDQPEYLYVAIAQHRLGQPQAFQSLIDSALVALPNDPWLYFNLASIHAQTNQEKAAIASLQKAIELGWQPNPLNWLNGTLCDPLLNPIRETVAYKTLVREHFPKYYDIATRVPGRK